MIFDSLPEPRNTISPARFATIFAVIFGGAFGLCAVSSTIGIDFSEQAATFLILATLIVEAICALGLIVIGSIAIIRAVRRRFQNSGESP